MEEKHAEHCALHLCFKITKIVLQAASVAAAFCMVKELHKVHKAIKKGHEHKKLL